jgi:TonB family protein
LSSSTERVRKFILPPGVILILAVLGSLSLHVPAYVGLGLLKMLMDRRPPAVALAPIEIELRESEPPTNEVEPEPAEEETAEQEDEEEEPRAEIAEREEPEEPEPQPVVPQTPPQEQPRQLQPEPMGRTSVAHRSRDPNVAPPEDAQHLAEENSRVEEETVARIRNPNVDDPDPQPADPEQATEESEEEGDAPEEEVAHAQDAPGERERDPLPSEVRRRTPDRREASRSPDPRDIQAAQGDANEGAREGDPRPERAEGGRSDSGGGERPTNEVMVTVRDRFGTFRMRVPQRPEGEGAGDEGGRVAEGPGEGRSGEGHRAGRARRSGRNIGEAGGPELQLSWSQFASVYGEEELQRQRELYTEQRRSHVRGMSRQERWRRFRAAIENYDVHVRPGNQTALNTRADPFAAYVASMHRRIHTRFADGFLRSLPSTVDEAFRANNDMHARLEILIAPDGSVASVGVVGTSGDLLFDFGAFNSVMTAQPFGPTPENIRSPDGNVYVHWSFYRNQRQCGTFNAQMFILSNAPEGRSPARRPLVDADGLFNPAPSEPSGELRDN